MRKSLLASAIVALASFSAVANEEDANLTTMSNFSYDYLEGRVGVSPLTYGAGFSMSIHPNAHVRVEADTEFDSDWDTAAGIGFHAPINNWADLTGELLARGVNKENFNSDVGLEINLGIRQWLGPQVEVGGEIGLLTVDDEEDTFGSAYGRFHATELFSLGAAYRVNEWYGDQFMFTTRFKY